MRSPSIVLGSVVGAFLGICGFVMMGVLSTGTRIVLHPTPTPSRSHPIIVGYGGHMTVDSGPLPSGLMIRDVGTESWSIGSAGVR